MTKTLRVLLVLLALMAWPQESNAQSNTRNDALYKCVSKSGAVSIQQSPCAANSKTAWRRYAPPESPPTYEQQVTQARDRAQREQDARELAQRAGMSQPQSPNVVYYKQPDARDLQRQQCAQAKADRDAWEKQVGLSRTYDMLRQWNETVYNACKGL